MKTISARYWNSPLHAAINNRRNVRIMTALQLNDTNGDS
jgi:hypothetical protein